MCCQGLLLLIGIKVLSMMTSLQKNFISSTEGLLMLMRSKLLIKMTRPQTINIKRTTFSSLVIFIKNFDLSRLWALEITMFCSKVIMTTTFIPIKSRRTDLAAHLILHLFQQDCFSTWRLLLYTWDIFA